MKSNPQHKLSLTVLPDRFAVCQFKPDAPLPEEASCCSFCSATRTEQELSVVLPEARVPDGARAEMGWRCLEVLGPLDFDLTGVLASFSVPLADADISIFAISTYNTDYILLRDRDLDRAKEVLSDCGHGFR